MCCRLNQLYSGDPKNAPDGEEDMQPDHRAVKAGGQKNDEASRKPIKHRTDFAVITCKRPHKGSWGIFAVSVRK